MNETNPAIVPFDRRRRRLALESMVVRDARVSVAILTAPEDDLDTTILWLRKEAARFFFLVQGLFSNTRGMAISPFLQYGTLSLFDDLSFRQNSRVAVECLLRRLALFFRK